MLKAKYIISHPFEMNIFNRRGRAFHIPSSYHGVYTAILGDPVIKIGSSRDMIAVLYCSSCYNIIIGQRDIMLGEGMSLYFVHTPNI